MKTQKREEESSEPIECIIIDDDPLCVLVQQKVMELVSNNVEFKIFANALEGLYYAKNNFPNIRNKKTLLLLDMQMPIMNGREFVMEFAKLDSNIQNQIKIVIISSCVFSIDLQLKSFKGLVSGFIAKPLTVDRAKELISDL